ncbi:putative integral membrane protein (TIGR02327 family) [Streptococcus gallinaceus]|uniref:DUF1146 family protein n=1 Tax=Streptococcus gallinaceus TaxID=165758 RepID=UPI00209F1444|nr:DUF1146 family protein [Streptococcus gallinaceus]MCP1638643.1 putative integral membrane protein (TIGR02327 family) [Streptococcus gallinaceus]MCP1769270.1 putative integral membrane protein (TIGR02327 family) [Streptococcus gallinaceus]
MIANILRLLSHLLFIYLAHDLLTSVVDWSKFLRGTAENKMKIQFLLLFVAIGLGYMVSTFFLDLLAISRSLALAVTQ